MAQLENKVSAACLALPMLAFKIHQQGLCGPNVVTAVSPNQIKIFYEIIMLVLFEKQTLLFHFEDGYVGQTEQGFYRSPFNLMQ